MRSRFVVITCLLVTTLLITPQIAQSVMQDESIKEIVKPSIEAGVEYLKRSQAKEGVWWYQGPGPITPQVVGATALSGIALMECGVSPSDRQVKAAADVVRRGVSDPSFNYSYSVCLCLIFLDRLHKDRGVNHSDRNTIVRLAKMIVEGQVNDGGWGYNLPSGNSDNSNTQFAVVALWIARKYGNPGGKIDKALGFADKKLRNSQRPDGGWGYDPTGVPGMTMNSTGSMTCAGILGIALYAGARKTSSSADFRAPGSASAQTDLYKTLEIDPAVAKARSYLLTSLNNYVGNNQQHREGHITYFFWSLERVATLYRWKKIDGVDWFDVGARYIMKIQDKRSGAWNIDFLHGPAVDTSFALLFLAKSNLLGALQDADFDGGKGIGGTVIAKDNKKPAPSKEMQHEETAKELLDKLLTALPPQQAAILDELSETRGVVYGQTLLKAISLLNSNAAKDAAREALANRYKRMNIKTLSDKMNDEDREERLAAANAARLKNDPQTASILIPLLADQDPGVSTAALEALKSISGQNFGKSVEQWSRWLEKSNPGKKP